MNSYDFVEFLVKENALDAFRTNLSNIRGETLKGFCDRLFGNEYSFLMVCFSWEETPEGFDYWCKLEDKWASKF